MPGYAFGYTGSPTPFTQHPRLPDNHGNWPAGESHNTIKDLLLGIQFDQRGSLGALSAHTGGGAVQRKWEKRLNAALFDAAAHGDCGMIHSALGQKADPGVRAVENGVTPLHLAAAHADSPEAIMKLVIAGATPNVVDNSDVSPLLAALQAGHSHSATSLLLLGADPSKLTKADSRQCALNAVLHHCPQNPGKDYVELTGELIKVAAAAPPTGQQVKIGGVAASFFDWWDAVALDDAPTDAEEMQMRISVMVCVANGWSGGLKALLSAGADARCVDHKSRRSALELADALLDHEVANILRSYGAEDIHPPREDHEAWALCLAASRGDWDAAVTWGREAELDWREPPPSDQNTNLMYAAIEGHDDIVKLLLGAGHTVDLLNNKGQSAATLARRRGHKSLADYLQQLETAMHWKRAQGLAKSQGHEPEDYMPSTNPAEHGFRWPVLYNLLMPPRGEEIPLLEPKRKSVWKEQLQEPPLPPPPPQEIQVDPNRLHVIILSCRDVQAGSFNFSLDPWVKVKCAGQNHQTEVIYESKGQPVFNAHFNFKNVGERDVLTCICWDMDTSIFGSGVPGESDDLLGRLDVPLSKHYDKLLSGQTIQIEERMRHQHADSDAYITISFNFPKYSIVEDIVSREDLISKLRY